MSTVRVVCQCGMLGYNLTNRLFKIGRPSFDCRRCRTADNLSQFQGLLASDVCVVGSNRLDLQRKEGISSELAHCSLDYS